MRTIESNFIAPAQVQFVTNGQYTTGQRASYESGTTLYDVVKIPIENGFNTYYLVNNKRHPLPLPIHLKVERRFWPGDTLHSVPADVPGEVTSEVTA